MVKSIITSTKYIFIVDFNPSHCKSLPQCPCLHDDAGAGWRGSSSTTWRVLVRTCKNYPQLIPGLSCKCSHSCYAQLPIYSATQIKALIHIIYQSSEELISLRIISPCYQKSEVNQWRGGGFPQSTVSPLYTRCSPRRERTRGHGESDHTINIRAVNKHSQNFHP